MIPVHASSHLDLVKPRDFLVREPADALAGVLVNVFGVCAGEDTVEDVVVHGDEHEDRDRGDNRGDGDPSELKPTEDLHSCAARDDKIG